MMVVREDHKVCVALVYLWAVGFEDWEGTVNFGFRWLAAICLLGKG